MGPFTDSRFNTWLKSGELSPLAVYTAAKNVAVGTAFAVTGIALMAGLAAVVAPFAIFMPKDQ